MVFLVRNAIFNFVSRNSLVIFLVSLPMYVNVANFVFRFCGFCFRFFCTVLFMFVSYSLLYNMHFLSIFFAFGFLLADYDPNTADHLVLYFI
jgi:hypothetical protein